jgi:hypothetical protein
MVRWDVDRYSGPVVHGHLPHLLPRLCELLLYRPSIDYPGAVALHRRRLLDRRRDERLLPLLPVILFRVVADTRVII